MTDNETLLEQALSIIEKKLEPDTFNEYFGKVTLHKEEGGFIFITVPNAFIKFRIERWHLNWMNEILSSLTPEKMQFKVISLEDALDENENSKKINFTNPDKNNPNIKRNLRSDYTFANFETGESNRFAFTSAMKVAESPHSLFNPLYIFGDVGLGKTHLMSAIGHYILDNNIHTNVVFTTAQQFAEAYFLATNTKRGKENIQDFYSAYRDADVLLVDDIQFLSNKPGTQEEFFKVFEDLYSKNKQIIITSDRTANELEHMMLRLKSRFGSGLVAPIKSPDETLCAKIIRRKLSHLLTNPLEVEESVISKLATTYKGSVRALEGALSTYVMYCSYLRLPYNIDSLHEALDSVIPSLNIHNNVVSKGVDNITAVQKAICTYFNISQQDLTGNSRKQNIVYARQLAIYIIRKRYNIHLKKIGDCFGGKDHTTILHACDKIENSILTDELINKDYELVLNLIEDSALSTN